MIRSFIPGGGRISPVQFWILLVLSMGPNYGYHIINSLSRMFGGYWKPKAGTIYPALEKLGEAGLVSSIVEHREDAPDRRYYTITETGIEALETAVKRWSVLMEHVEAYGEAHRSISKFKGNMTREEVGRLLIAMGEGLKKGRFNVSDVLPELEASLVEPTDPLQVKFLYAWEDGKLEIELEFEWLPESLVEE